MMQIFREINDRDDVQCESETDDTAQEENRNRERIGIGAERSQSLKNTRKHMMFRRKREVERVTAALDKILVQWMDQQIE